MLCAILSGCSSGQPASEHTQQPAKPVPADARVSCAIAGAASLAPDCTVERDGGSRIVRHPDGGFRRFATLDGRIVADGAEPGRIEGDVISIARDRYRVSDIVR